MTATKDLLKKNYCAIKWAYWHWRSLDTGSADWFLISSTPLVLIFYILMQPSPTPVERKGVWGTEMQNTEVWDIYRRLWSHCLVLTCTLLYKYHYYYPGRVQKVALFPWSKENIFFPPGLSQVNHVLLTLSNERKTEYHWTIHWSISSGSRTTDSCCMRLKTKISLFKLWTFPSH